MEAATGRIANTDLMDYLQPVRLDVPPVGGRRRQRHLQRHGQRVHELPIIVDELL